MNKKLLNKIHQIIEDNKTINIITINLKGKSSIADFMVVASGTSSRHIQSVSEILLQKLKENKKLLKFGMRQQIKFSMQ